VNLVLVAHGTRKSAGLEMIGDLAARVGAMLKRPVHVAFLDVLGPTPTEVLNSVGMLERPTVVVPAFLSRGYHVAVDLPAHVAASGHPMVTVTAPLGPCPRMVQVVFRRLVESGWHPGDSVILAAAGTSDCTALSDLHTTATMLSAIVGQRVELAFAATGEPRVADAVAIARTGGARRVVVASYLLADGLFQDRLRHSGADLVTEPLGLHPGTARVIADRFLMPSGAALPRNLHEAFG
jgi:sirohydrochlorin ferrochelatase